MLGEVAERLRLGDMPPKDAPQPSKAEREQLLSWINAALDAEAAARLGDAHPGVVCDVPVLCHFGEQPRAFLAGDRFGGAATRRVAGVEPGALRGR